MSTQTVQTAINVATAKAKAEAKDAAAVKNKAKDYFDHQLEKKKADPEGAKNKAAVARGLADAQTFIDVLKDSSHPSHALHVALLKNQYDSSYDKVKKTYTDKAVADMDAHEPEMRNPIFEKQTLEAFKPKVTSTKEQNDMYDAFKSSVKAAWNKSGYRANAGTVKDLADQYGLKRAGQ